MGRGVVDKSTSVSTSTEWSIGAGNRAEQRVSTSPSGDKDKPKPYRLYHFLSDVDQILELHEEPWQIMQGLLPLVRRLVGQSDWLDDAYLQPDPEGPWAVYNLFDAPGYPLTVQTAVWSPGQAFPPHNHAGWGIVAVLSGTEENTLWRRVDDSSGEGPAPLVAEKNLQFQTGDIVAFDPYVIHSVQTSANTPTATFNIYGPADFSSRLEYDVEAGTAHLF
jgi:predicted metal-dependent enzyme (double-stranded beta helix superfamily)